MFKKSVYLIATLVIFAFTAFSVTGSVAAAGSCPSYSGSSDGTNVTVGAPFAVNSGDVITAVITSTTTKDLVQSRIAFNGSYTYGPTSSTTAVQTFTVPSDGTAQVDFDSGTFGYTYSVSVSGCASNFAGRGIPDGFVLRTITCDVTVFDAAGGHALATGEKIIGGQTWYVNPTPVVVGKTSWTEIFVSGLINGYIPTSCVGK